MIGSRFSILTDSHLRYNIALPLVFYISFIDEWEGERVLFCGEVCFCLRCLDNNQSGVPLLSAFKSSRGPLKPKEVENEPRKSWWGPSPPAEGAGKPSRWVSPLHKLHKYREAFLLRPTFLSLVLKPKDGYLITHRLGCPFCYFSPEGAPRAAPRPPHGSEDHFLAHAPCRLSMLNMPANFEFH